MSDYVSEDTRLALLLCAAFEKEKSERTLSSREYAAFCRAMKEKAVTASELLEGAASDELALSASLMPDRVRALLDRAVSLGFALEQWESQGLWIYSVADAAYPVRYKSHLADQAPPLLFGAGNLSLLEGGGLAMVGSRHVDPAGEGFTREVAGLCAEEGMPVVSGGARGVDQISMRTAVEHGGVSLGVLADSLLKRTLEEEARYLLGEGRLLLVSPFHPEAGFTVGTAMARNKFIYALADYGLVVSADHQKGGTWAGAVEELKRDHGRPVFVRTGEEVPPGNEALQALGALPWPTPPYETSLMETLQQKSEDIPRAEQGSFDF
ncbi:MAG: DNA-processing protein DprA [Candidatus Hydrogenedens sp.]|jgi:predicted Rossmann fold nucleotide-binding protein DprA/Smf involved in DNA uptake|nr:DNA-processing protein DprA [Candidatus Hydrogenedens sp.]